MAAPTLQTSNTDGKSFERLYGTDRDLENRYGNPGRGGRKLTPYYIQRWDDPSLTSVIDSHYSARAAEVR